MRKNHRGVALILALTLLLNLLLPGSAFAADLEAVPTFEVGTAQGKPGDTVEIPIYVKNNPGIASIKLSVTYDKGELKLTGANVNMTQGNVMNSPTLDAQPYILNWVNGMSNCVDANFTFATLTFSILEGAPSGHKDIQIEYDPDDIYNVDYDGIVFNVQNGGITIPHTTVTALVDAPAKGAALDTSVDVGGATGYTGTVEWYEGNFAAGTAVTGSAKANQIYTAKIILIAGEGEIFDDSLNGTTSGDGYQIAKTSDTELALTKTFPATLAKELQTLEVTTQPSKTTYTHGDQFNPENMVVKATYDDGTVDENFTDYTVEYLTNEKSYLKKNDAKVTLKAGSQSVEVTGLTVNAKELTISGLTSTDRAYDGTTAVTLSGGTLTGIVAGETVSATMPTTGTVGDATVGNGKTVTISSIALTGTDAGNYTLALPTVTVNISPKALANNMINLGTQKTYSGNEQEVVITSVMDGGNSLTKDSDYIITSGDKATNVGNTTLTIAGIGNYSGSAIAAWSLQKATPAVSDFSVTAPTSEGVPYTGGPISVATPTTDKVGMGAVTVKYGSDTTAPIDVGSYTVTFDVAEGSNYTAASGLGIGTLEIKRSEYTGPRTKDVTVRSNQEVADKKLTLPDLPAGAAYGTVTVTTNNGLLNGTPTVSGTELTYSVNSSSADTSEKVTIAVTGATNYEDYSVEVTFTAKDKDDAGVTVAPSSVTVKFDKTVTITASKTHSGAGTWTWTYPADSFEAVGETNASSITLKAVKADTNVKTISVKFENDTHMGIGSASVTVNKADPVVSMAPTAKTNLVYTGSAQALINEGAATGGELQYNVDDTSYAAAIPTGTNAKSYIVKYKVVGDANHEDSTEQTLTVVIAKADPDIGTVSKTAPATIYPHTDAITLEKTGSTPGTLVLTAGQTLTVGTKDYNWTFTPDDTDNYNPKTGAVSLTVTEDLLASISVKDSTAPTKTTYTWGEEFSITGAIIEATYESGAKKDIATDKLTYSKVLTVGQNKVEVSYTEGNITKTCDITGLTVDKADARTLADVPVILKFDVTAEQTVALNTVGMPSDAGTLTYVKGTEETTGSVAVASWSVDASTGEVKYTLAGAATGDTVTLPVTISSVNYEDSAVKVTITLTDKDVPNVLVQNITRTYTGEAVPASAITGTATINNAPVVGAWSWKETQNLTDVADSGVKTVVFTPVDSDVYASVEANLTLTINKATPVGTPSFTEITTDGKTLADAALNIGTITPVGGTISWDDGDSDTVEANTAYGWTYVPSDTANYTNLTGSITPYQKNEGGDGPSIPDPPTHTHNYSSIWSSDSNSHWHACTASGNCDTPKVDLSAHISNGGIMTSYPTAYTEGVRTYSCVVCGYVIATETIPATGPSYPSYPSTPNIPNTSGETTTTPAVTVPVSGDQNTVLVSASVYGSTATVSKIDTTQINNVIGENVRTGIVEIDFTDLGKVINTVKLPASSIGEIAEAAKEQGNDVKGLTLKLSTGEISFDGDALSAIQNQAGSQVTVIVTPAKTNELNARQRGVVGDAPIFELTIQSGGRTITDFKGGYATVALPYTLKLGEDPAGIVVYNLDNTGNIHPCETMYDVRTGAAIFTTGHLSLYFVGYDQTAVPQEVQRMFFTDILPGTYYYDAVAWAINQSITAGVSATTFGPEAPCTRGQIVTFLWRAAGSPSVSRNNPFTDVRPGDYWYDAVLWAVSKGITTGTSATTFSPNDTCTRGQTVTFLYRNAGSPTAAAVASFTDVLPSAYYSDAVAWALARNITNGTTTTTFGPDDQCTRGQIVTFLYRDLGE